MRRFDFYLPIELFERIQIMANFYGMSKAKMMIKLLELGYLKMLQQRGGYNDE